MILDHLDYFSRKTFISHRHASSASISFKYIRIWNGICLIFSIFLYFIIPIGGNLWIFILSGLCILISSVLFTLEVNFIMVTTGIRNEMKSSNTTNLTIRSILHSSISDGSGSQHGITRWHVQYILEMLQLVVLVYFGVSNIMTLLDLSSGGAEDCRLVENSHLNHFLIFFFNMFPGLAYCDEGLSFWYVVSRYLLNISIVGVAITQVSNLLNNTLFK